MPRKDVATCPIVLDAIYYIDKQAPITTSQGIKKWISRSLIYHCDPSKWKTTRAFIPNYTNTTKVALSLPFSISSFLGDVGFQPPICRPENKLIIGKSEFQTSWCKAIYPENQVQIRWEREKFSSSNSETKVKQSPKSNNLRNNII